MVQPAHFALFSLVLLLLTRCTIHPDFETCRGEPKLQEGRQGPKSLGERLSDMHQTPLRFPDARVVAESATATGAAISQRTSTPDQAKHSGEAAGQIARARRVKRAHQRAVRRARNSEDGTTMYRGRRLTLAQLGGAPESAVIAPPRQPCPPSSTSRRIRVLSKNVGGMCTSTHDVFMNWLTSARNPYDVVSSRRHTTDWAAPSRSTGFLDGR